MQGEGLVSQTTQYVWFNMKHYSACYVTVYKRTQWELIIFNFCWIAPSELHQDKGFVEEINNLIFRL